jgi:tripartite-type tricarboxylate transporter receptor subunit TctC
LFVAGIATAQDWPTRSVRVVSPFAAGGSSDTVGRVIGEALSEKFGQQFVLENSRNGRRSPSG